MSAVLDLVAGLRELLEPGERDIDDVTVVQKDLAGAEPLKWDPNTLYVFPFRNTTRPIETAATLRQDFGLVAVFVAPSSEEARTDRDPEVSALLDTKRAAYMEAIRTHQVTTLWDHLQAAERPRPPRTLQTRAVAIEATGYRIVS